MRVKLVTDKDERLKGFCSITMDREFLVRDIKIIEGTGGPFVAMPSRKMCDHCKRCGAKNHLKARFCNDCGAKLKENRARRKYRGKVKLHADVAHPVNAEFRKKLHDQIIAAFNAEVEKSKEPDYEPTELDGMDEDIPEVV
ncbi:MAG: SpoVG family protein [Phycisphaerales bacterium]|nr:MAG: SpoVG family protein [Phycisphaerales bacterium]